MTDFCKACGVTHDWVRVKLPASEWRLGDYLKLNGVPTKITKIDTIGERVEVECEDFNGLGKFDAAFEAFIGRVPDHT